jgi:hypothetical protein
MRSSRRTFLRDFEAGRLLDLVLVMAVLSVLLIRFWLHFTGFPQIGGDTLHIAHMLWGGVLMLAALVLLLAFLDDRAHRLAAVLGGIGFGTFIDEVGKFITKDNDYFYEPAVSVIYVVFVLLYLAGRSLIGRQQASPTENVVNALRSTGEMVTADAERGERDRALSYLDASGDTGSLATALRAALVDATLVDDRPAERLPGLVRHVVGAYRRVAASRWFGWALVAFFALQLAAAGLRLVLILPWFAPRTIFLANVPLVTPLPPDPDQFAVADWLQLGSGLVAGVFVARGMVAVFRDRLYALRLFLRATVVTLCLTQAFLFYRVEWMGLGALAINLMVLAGLRFAIDHERDEPPA